MNYVKSPLNYIGGKYKLLKQIIPLLPIRIQNLWRLAVWVSPKESILNIIVKSVIQH